MRVPLKGLAEGGVSSVKARKPEAVTRTATILEKTLEREKFKKGEVAKIRRVVELLVKANTPESLTAEELAELERLTAQLPETNIDPTFQGPATIPDDHSFIKKTVVQGGGGTKFVRVGFVK